MLERAGDKDLNEVKQDVLAAVRAHTGGSLAHDVTMLAIEVPRCTQVQWL